MEPTPRTGAKSLLAVGCALVAAMLAATPASADPALLSAKFSNPPTVGRTTHLQLRVVDTEAPVSGAVATFGREGSFGSSACSPPDSTGRSPGPPFSAGSRVRISIPHSFSSVGQLTGLVRVDTGGCLAIGDSLLQPFTVSVAAPGQIPAPLVLGQPVSQIPGATTPSPSLPGLGDLPTLPPLPSVPTLPDADGTLPALPTPQLPNLPIAGVTAARAACRGASRRVRNSRRSRLLARRAVLCLLNRERRARGLRPLRHQRRLFKASFRHSRAMVRRGFFAHVQPGGIGLLTRLLRVRYLPGRRWLVGENIAWGMRGFETPARIVRGWMLSTGHRANILRPQFREIGIGVYRGAPLSRKRGATYTTDFGFRR